MTDQNTVKLPCIGTPTSVAMVSDQAFPQDESKSVKNSICPDSIGSTVYKERRIEPRISVRWHAEVFVDEHNVGMGLVRRISSKGADILIDRNLQSAKFIRLHIYVTGNFSNTLRLIKVSGRTIYSIYDSEEYTFRSGINFLEFKQESDRTYLQNELPLIHC